MKRIVRPFVLIFGMVVVFVMIPITLVAKLWFLLFGRGSNLTAEDVASFIRSGLDPQDDGRWDEFGQFSIRDERLENIRQRAVAVKFPLNEADRAMLKGLLVELESEQGCA
jgi:hypothetical protein